MGNSSAKRTAEQPVHRPEELMAIAEVSANLQKVSAEVSANPLKVSADANASTVSDEVSHNNHNISHISKDISHISHISHISENTSANTSGNLSEGEGENQ
jgi:hypothetical protein